MTCVLCIHLRLLLRGGKGGDFEMGNRFCERGQNGGKETDWDLPTHRYTNHIQTYTYSCFS